MSVMLFVMGAHIECNYHMKLSEGGAEGLEKQEKEQFSCWIYSIDRMPHGRVPLHG